MISDIMNKEFLSVETIRDNAIRIAEQMYKDNFIPTVIYVSLRGGATLGNVISEYFKLIANIDSPPLYAAVVSHSYQEFKSTTQIHIDGWTYEPKFLRKSDKVLLVDDIFDSGLTINYLADILIAQGLTHNRLKIAVHDYKIRCFEKQTHKYIPNYYGRKITINTPTEDNWIHYLSHELDGLTEEELEKYFSDEIIPIIKNLLEIREKQKNS